MHLHRKVEGPVGPEEEVEGFVDSPKEEVGGSIGSQEEGEDMGILKK